MARPYSTFMAVTIEGCSAHTASGKHLIPLGRGVERQDIENKLKEKKNVQGISNC